MKGTQGILTLVIAVLLFTTVHSQEDEEMVGTTLSLNCFHSISWRFFDLKPLMMDGDDTYYQSEREVDGQTFDVYFDFCRTLTESRQCKEVQSTAAEGLRGSDFQETCRSLTKKSGSNEKASLSSGNGNGEHLVLEYTSEDDCEFTEGEKFGVTYEIYCDSKIDSQPEFTLNTSKTNNCRPYFTTRHKAGCKVGDLNGLWRFIETYNIVFGIICMVIGLYLSVLGRKLIRPTIGLIF
jgi:hypothetical protein